ncbi:MAG: chorion class high-cysteine HCB protein 13 [Clostridium sp.]|nr:chorion class high-cysteine HCB protein 13 [Clostridium sp.]
MSDLTATGCGCGNPSSNNGFGCSSIIWIILLLSCCGNGNGLNGLFGNSDNGCCDSIIWIILLLACCGNGNGNSCGCGC